MVTVVGVGILYTGVSRYLVSSYHESMFPILLKTIFTAEERVLLLTCAVYLNKGMDCPALG